MEQAGEVTDVIPFDSATNVVTAEQIAKAAAWERFKSVPLTTMLKNAKEDFRLYKVHATNAFTRAYTLGQRLIVIKRKMKHGDFLGVALSIVEGESRNTVSQFMQVAKFAALLPAKDPEGGPWTVNRALAYVRTRNNVVAEMHGDPRGGLESLSDDVPPAVSSIEAINQRTVQRVKEQRAVERGTRLKDEVMKVYRKLDDALDKEDRTAPEAVFALRDHAETLVKKVHRLDRKGGGPEGGDPDSWEPRD